jgi:hypothetical protein
VCPTGPGSESCRTNQCGYKGILIHNTSFGAIEIGIAVPISGIQCFFDPRIRDGKKLVRDGKNRIRDGQIWIRDRHSGSATLIEMMINLLKSVE